MSLWLEMAVTAADEVWRMESLAPAEDATPPYPDEEPEFLDSSEQWYLLVGGKGVT